MEKYYERSRVTDWSYQDILKDLGLKESDLEGKRVLDIGSGGACLAREKGNPNIFSLDPRYGQDSDNFVIRKAESKLKKEKLPVVAGLGEELPFADETFDLVVSHYGVPMYHTDLTDLMKGEELVGKSIKEMVRVLKPEGQIRLYSVLNRDFAPEKEWIEKALTGISNSGLYAEYSGQLMVITKKKIETE